MSVFRDDIGLSNALQNVQEKVLLLGTTKNSKSPEVQDSQKTENPETEDFEKIDLTSATQKKQETTSNLLEKIQEEKNLLETAGSNLSSIKDNLKDIDFKLKERLNNNFDENKTEEITGSVKEDLKKIKDSIDKTSFNGINPFDADSSDKSRTNDKNSSIIDTLSSFKEDSSDNLNLENIHEISLQDKKLAEEFQKKVEKQIAYIEQRHRECLEFQNKIIDKVDSLIEFGLQPEKTPQKLPETDTQLKETAVKSISDNPETAKKAQILNLDGKIILGLLSITRT